MKRQNEFETRISGPFDRSGSRSPHFLSIQSRRIVSATALDFVQDLSSQLQPGRLCIGVINARPWNEAGLGTFPAATAVGNIERKQRGSKISSRPN